MIFITGHKGRIGKFVVGGLSGYEIVGYDKVDGEDILDIKTLTEKMKGAETVIHLAGIPHPHRNPSSEEMNMFFEINVRGTLNVLSAAVKNEVKRFIYLSSTVFYGCSLNGKMFPLYFPIDERHPQASIEGLSQGALDAYSQSKVMAEELLAYFGTNGLIETIALRSSPANEKKDQFEDGFDWKEIPLYPDYRRTNMWANCSPLNIAQAVKILIDTESKFTYEAFNVIDKYTDSRINIKEFIERDYPNTEIRIDLTNNPCLFSTEKLEKLGFKAIDNV